jgi:glycosyltransferase involved in cell wall biosynthesis
VLTSFSSPLSHNLRVAIVSPVWPADKHTNGIVTYAAGIVSGLRAIGTRTHVVAFESPEESDLVHPAPDLPAGKPWPRRIVNRVAWWLAPHACWERSRSASLASVISRLQRDDNVNLVEMEESFGLARLVARRTTVPVVVRLHGPWFLIGDLEAVRQDADFRRRVTQEGLALEYAAGVSSPSQDILRRAREFYGLDLPNAEVIPNPVMPAPEASRWSPSRCDPRRLLYVGRFGRLKGADTLVEAFANVLKAQPEMRLTFVGSDYGLTDRDGKFRRAEEFIRNRLGDAARQLEWLGPVPASQVLALRRQCMATIVCSRYENFSMAALEAMACGCPLVVTRVGGLPEMVQDNRNGLLCEANDPAGLACCILRLMREPELAARLGHQAYVDATRLYHPEVVAERMVAFYRRVIERSAPKQPLVCGTGIAQ